MAEEALVIPELPESHITLGEQLIAKLDRNNLDIRAAFWFLFVEDSERRLVLVSPRVGREGSLRLYQIIGRELRRLGPVEPPLPLGRVALYDVNDPFIVPWYGVLRTTDGSGNRMRFTRCMVNRLPVSDALVYRMQLPTRVQVPVQAAAR